MSRDGGRARGRPDTIIRHGGGGHRHAGWCGGWWLGARRRWSPNAGTRPRGRGGRVTLAIVHSISLPPGEYGGDAVERLFTNRLDTTAHPYYERLQGMRVSAHFFVRRNGVVLQFVSVRRRAWHAGVSNWRGRSGCNDFSVGIEVEGLEGERFERRQYEALSRLLRALRPRWPLQDVAGHEHVAPGRKHDPGPGFDWTRLAQGILRGRGGRRLVGGARSIVARGGGGRASCGAAGDAKGG